MCFPGFSRRCIMSFVCLVGGLSFARIRVCVEGVIHGGCRGRGALRVCGLW